MTAPQKTGVLSVQTPLLGNRTYGELIRKAFADSDLIDFDAHWSTEAWDAHKDGALERQLDRVFRKMVERPFVRRRNLDFFTTRFELGTSYWARRTLSSLLQTRRPDVLHFHTQSLAMLSLDVMARIPTVVSADGTSFLAANQMLEKPWRWTFGGSHLLERLVFHRAAAVITFSRWAARSIVADHGLDPQRVHVIPPGIDLTQFPALAEGRHGEQQSGPRRILFVGGEFERKGGPLLVEAFLARFGSEESVELHLVTNAATIPRHPRIFVHEGIAAYSPAWHELYRTADIFVMPTKRDQSPIVFLEAMAAGLPVVTTPVGSASEAVIDGGTGYIVPQNDAIALQDRMTKLLDDPELRARFGAAGRAHVEASFEAKTNARVLENVLRDAARPRV